MAATLPSDPLARFLSIATHLAAYKRWFEGPTIVRYAALPLLLADGEPASLAARIDREGTALAEQQGWFNDLRGAMRFLIAGWLVASGRDPAAFTSACEVIRGRFRAEGVRRGGAYEVVAATMLHVAQAGDPQHVRRLQRIYEAMKKHHWWLTGPDDLPASALLAVRGGDVAAIERRCEDLYQRLRAGGLGAGSGLQLASHLLCLLPGAEADLAQRFLTLHEGFKAAGIQMWDTDRDELALLCALPAEPRDLVHTVVEHRGTIRDALGMVGPTVSFSLACGTAFFAAHAGQTLDERTARDVELATLAMAANAATVHEAGKRAAHSGGGAT